MGHVLVNESNVAAQRGDTCLQESPHSKHQTGQLFLVQESTVVLAAGDHLADKLAMRNRNCSASRSAGCRERFCANRSADWLRTSSELHQPCHCTENVPDERAADVVLAASNAHISHSLGCLLLEISKCCFAGKSSTNLSWDVRSK